MNTITSAELTGMRDEVNDTLTQSATIKRPAGVSDGRGQRTTVYNTVASNVGCRVRVFATPGETQLGERNNAVTLFAISFKYDQDVTAKDRVVVGSDTFEVMDTAAAGPAVLQRVAIASRIQ
jgi:head-tail adaptor